MARVLQQGEWYEQLASEALYEEEFETILKANASHIFPSHVLVPFKKIVSSENGTAKADFALVHHRYQDWWVVEAEMSHHSLSGHVLPQVETLSQANYDSTVADYLADREPALSRDRMRSTIKGLQPRVLVIVNAPAATWQRELRPFGALVMVFEIFRSRHNKHLFRVNGERPIGYETIRSECSVELARFLRVHSPGILAIRSGESLTLSFRGGVTSWIRTDLEDRVYLTSSKPISLDRRAAYDLLCREDETFELVEQS